MRKEESTSALPQLAQALAAGAVVVVLIRMTGTTLRQGPVECLAGPEVGQAFVLSVRDAPTG